MKEHKYTVVVPTRERADTLLHTLRTCVTQNYDNLTILVSDNCSQDTTEEVVRSFNDPRIQYVNTGKRLSMSHNWEFALSHVREGYVTFLGDDDGLLPDAVQDVNALFNETGLQAVNMNPAPDFYFWPSYFNKKQANMLKVSFQSGFVIKEGKAVLRKVLQCREDYLPLPFVYSSFVNMTAIEPIQRKTGAFFRSQIPDVYSGIALANQVGAYVYSKKRLRISGASSHSTGMSQFNYDANKKAMDKFASEPNIPFHPALHYCPSYTYLIAESFLQSFDAGLNPDEKAVFNWMPFIETAIKEANTKFHNQRDNILNVTRYIAETNHLDRERVEKIIHGSTSRLNNIIPYDLKRYSYPFLLINAATYGVENIFDACQLHRTITDNPSRFWLKSTTWKDMSRMVFGELADRYASA
ncbi:glycosyltransferase [Larkinella sp. GY13]|uniref:glycosyltransferase n=1 Tax=Larkinella sp. GY13 TaxID=3453720 RepID=UPI003EEE1813